MREREHFFLCLNVYVAAVDIFIGKLMLNYKYFQFKKKINEIEIKYNFEIKESQILSFAKYLEILK